MIDPHEEERLRKFARDSVNLQILFAEIDRLREEVATLKATVTRLVSECGE